MTKFHEDYNSPIPFVRSYFRRIISVEMGMFRNMPRESLILDFGCGKQYLKEVSNFTIIGYDIVPEYSDIEDYMKLKPEVIVCNHVLEHLSLRELREILDNFKKMGPKFIITGIPTENIISKMGVILFRTKSHSSHKTKIDRIHTELNKRFQLVQRRNILTLTIVSKWQMKV